MDDRTGKLIRLEKDQTPPVGFHVIPVALSEVAQAELAEQQETIIDPSGPEPLSQHLRDRRRMMQKRIARRRRARKRKV